MFAGIASSEVTYTVSFSSSDLSFEKRLDYDLVRLSDCAFMDDVGKPMLPVHYVKLIIPAVMEVDSIEFPLKKDETISGTFHIYPAQPPIPIGNYPGTPEFVGPDSAIYSLDSPFPGRLAEVVHDGYFDGNHIVDIAVYPIQYIPLKGNITLYKEIELKLVLKGSTRSPVRALKRREHEQRIYREALRSLVANT